MNTETNLLSEFNRPSKSDWRAAADQLLKGKPFDKLMKEDSPEGIELESIFWKDVLDDCAMAKSLPGFDGCLRGTRAAGNAAHPWDIAQDLALGSPEAFNKAAHEALNGGQHALRVTFDQATLKGIDPPDAHPGEVGLCGLSLSTREDFATAFKGIDPTQTPIHLSTRCSGLGIAALFFNWLHSTGYDFEKVKGSFAADPVADLASLGRLPASQEDLFNEQYALADFCIRKAPNFQALGVSTLPYNLAGASGVEELAAALATGNLYLSEMIQRGLSVNEIAPQIRFTLTIGPNFFMEIAKFRAVRVLWSQIVETYGGSSEAQKINLHARTGLYNKTKIDPYVNMLRTTTEALSAAIAGVDSLCVGHFDEVARHANPFSQRIARNSQVILQEECGLTDVTDPAGGSWAVEWLTQKIAEKSWKRFQEIEAEGGIVKALRNGSLGKSLAETEALKQKRFQHRRNGLVGTNLYPNNEELPLPSEASQFEKILNKRIEQFNDHRSHRGSEAIRRLAEILGYKACYDYRAIFTECLKAARAGSTLGEISRSVRSEVQLEPAIKPLPCKRLAESYEDLRRAAEKIKGKTGKAPALCLLNLGVLSRHKPRAEFSTAFFTAGGFQIESSPPLNSIDEVLTALEKTEASIIVICGHDEDYATYFSSYARAIKSVNPEVKLLLAGFPGEHEQAFREAGMDDFIHIKSNNLIINQTYQAELGIS
jgi:methylmalonyl-CoA mutase